ncbi:aspartate:proton symporter [Alicyclobacillus acidoterrestris]|uniref:APC family permease n=1 Tax=Alicyclobacillus suci TaxID=2816080 RepID=UPI0011958164|nr:APC family permease [Alicyclobacillus suci]GEO25389.1 aspartate:proton symporter [Alicyclobacillus acidoterrestris]
MEQNGKLKKRLSLSDLIFIGFGAIFGSGWLFASSTVASDAGPAGWISWLIGGIAVILLGLVYAELGGAIPRAGGIVRYPVYSHGPLLGYLMGFATLIAYSSLCSIEVEAARQYAASWWPALSSSGGQSPSLLGWILQVALLFVFFLLNYWSVGTFAKVNTVMTILKFVVPSLTIIVLLIHLKSGNFTVHGFAPFGVSGIETAISTGGVMFAYLGLQPIVSVASEAKRPQRTVPLALILSVILSAVVYILLQVSFIGAIPTAKLAGGWTGISQAFSLPFRDLAVMLGIGWLAILIVLDAIVSPSGSANIFMNSTSRIVFGWAKNGTLFKLFGRIDKRTGIPRPALWLSFVFSIFWTLPFPSWGTLIGVVSDALVLTYALAPISAYAFRRNAPQLARPFYLKGMHVIGPIAFIIASLIVYWTGWTVDSWLLGSQLVMFVIYVIAYKWVPKRQVSFMQQLKASWWLVFYYAAIIIVSKLGDFGGIAWIPRVWDQVVIAVIAVITYYWGGRTGLPKAMLDEDEMDEEGSDT